MALIYEFYMDEIKEIPKVETNCFSDDEANVTIQYYQQACNHARAYMDLRFKHFGTLIVIMTLLSAGVIKLPNDWEKALCSLVGFLISSLFWILDHRTCQYLAKHWNDVYKIENFFRSKIPNLCEVVPVSEKPKRKLILRASMITNYLFALFCLIWLFSLLFHLDKYYHWEIFELSTTPILKVITE